MGGIILLHQVSHPLTIDTEGFINWFLDVLPCRDLIFVGNEMMQYGNLHVAFNSKMARSCERIDCDIVLYRCGFKKISIPTPWKVMGNSEWEGSHQPKFIRESMKLNWKFHGGGRIQMKKSFHGGGMDIFWSHKIS